MAGFLQRPDGMQEVSPWSTRAHPSTQAAQPGFALDIATASPDGHHRIQVSGKLPQGWIGRLSYRLAERGFDIRSGFGGRDVRGYWTARIEFASHVGSQDPATLDFESLVQAEEGIAHDEVTLELDSWLVVGPAQDGCLGLSVVGRDRVGFLASLLRQLALLSLFPYEFSITTEGSIVRDRFSMKGIGGRRPSAEVCEELRRSLDTLVVRRPASDRSVAFSDDRGTGARTPLAPEWSSVGGKTQGTDGTRAPSGAASNGDERPTPTVVRRVGPGVFDVVP